MICFKHIFLPTSFLSLLKKDSNNYEEYILSLRKDDLEFDHLISRYLSRNDFKEFKTFRNKLASVYLEYFYLGSPPSEVDMSFINELIDFESQFDQESSNRAFMLAFYLKLLSLNHYDKSSIIYQPNGELNNAFEFVKIIKPKEYFIDWAFLIIYLISNNSNQCLDQERSVFEMIEGLEKNKRIIFFNSMIAYGSSIQDCNIFSEPIKE